MLINHISYLVSISCQQILDEAHSSPGLHAAAGPGLAEECATLVWLLLIASAVMYCYKLDVGDIYLCKFNNYYTFC